MPHKMSKKEEKAWKKKLGKKIYEEAFNKAKAEVLRERRKKRISEIKEKARVAAQKKYSMTRGEKIKSGISKAHGAYAKAQKSYNKKTRTPSKKRVSTKRKTTSKKSSSSKKKSTRKKTRESRSKSVWDMGLDDLF